jgi:hypothetical protein
MQNPALKEGDYYCSSSFLLPIPMFHHNMMKFVVFRNLIASQLFFIKFVCVMCVFFGA